MTDPSPSRRAPAAGRAIDILDALASEGEPLGVSELSRRLGVPKSSVFGICETLAEAGVLHGEAAGYSLTAHCLRWSGAYLKRSSIVTEFHRLLARDPRLAQYTVTLSTLQGRNVVYLACQNSDKPLGVTFQPGMQIAAVYSATGKAMLAHLPEAEMQSLINGDWPAPYTRHGTTDAAAFARSVSTWRSVGYAVDDGEIRDGMVCLGAPIFNHAGRPVAGVALSLTSVEAAAELRDELGQLIVEIAAALRH